MQASKRGVPSPRSAVGVQRAVPAPAGSLSLIEVVLVSSTTGWDHNQHQWMTGGACGHSIRTLRCWEVVATLPPGAKLETTDLKGTVPCIMHTGVSCVEILPECQARKPTKPMASADVGIRELCWGTQDRQVSWEVT